MKEHSWSDLDEFFETWDEDNQNHKSPTLLDWDWPAEQEVWEKKNMGEGGEYQNLLTDNTWDLEVRRYKHGIKRAINKGIQRKEREELQALDRYFRNRNEVDDIDLDQKLVASDFLIGEPEFFRHQVVEYIDRPERQSHNMGFFITDIDVWCEKQQMEADQKELVSEVLSLLEAEIKDLDDIVPTFEFLFLYYWYDEAFERGEFYQKSTAELVQEIIRHYRLKNRKQKRKQENEKRRIDRFIQKQKNK